jgi:hypothetical protein
MTQQHFLLVRLMDLLLESLRLLLVHLMQFLQNQVTLYINMLLQKQKLLVTQHKPHLMDIQNSTHLQYMV